MWLVIPGCLSLSSPYLCIHRTIYWHSHHMFTPAVNKVPDSDLKTWRLRRNERRAAATCGERSPPPALLPSEGQTSSGCRCPEQQWKTKVLFQIFCYRYVYKNEQHKWRWGILLQIWTHASFCDFMFYSVFTRCCFLSVSKHMKILFAVRCPSI